MDLEKISKFVVNTASSYIKGAVERRRRKEDFDGLSTIIEGNELTIQEGDFVRDDNGYYMVVKSRTEYSKGILVLIDNLKQCEWFLAYEYCPYCRGLRLHSPDESIAYAEKSESYSKHDGKSNTQKVESLKTKFDNKSAEWDTYLSGPSPNYRFPVLDFIKSKGDDFYIPAIHELYDLFMNKQLASRFTELFNLTGNCLPAKFYIWSSTENTNTSYSQDILTLLVSDNVGPIVQSHNKVETAFIIPFKNF